MRILRIAAPRWPILGSKAHGALALARLGLAGPRPAKTESLTGNTHGIGAALPREFEVLVRALPRYVDGSPVGELARTRRLGRRPNGLGDASSRSDS